MRLDGISFSSTLKFGISNGNKRKRYIRAADLSGKSREDGPWEIAEIIHTPCTSRREEKPKNAAVVMTAENTTGLKLSPNNSLRISYLNTLILSKNHLALQSKLFFLLAVGHRVKYALRNSEALPQYPAPQIPHLGRCPLQSFVYINMIQ